jgi:hypothetical protein
MFQDNGLLKSTKSVPMAGLYGHFLENPDLRTAACIAMGYRRLTSAAREEIETFGYSVNYRKRTCSDGVSQQN